MAHPHPALLRALDLRAPCGVLGVGEEAPRAEDLPRREREAEAARHGEDLAFEGALGEGPLALVDREGRLGMVERVLVRLGDEPGGGVLCETLLRQILGERGWGRRTEIPR